METTILWWKKDYRGQLIALRMQGELRYKKGGNMKRLSRIALFCGSVLIQLTCTPGNSKESNGPLFCRGINMERFLWGQTGGARSYTREKLKSYWPAWDGQKVAIPEHRIESLKAMKFDHVRLFVHPVPLLQETEDMRERLLNEVFGVVRHLQSDGFSVVLTFAFGEIDESDLKERIETSSQDADTFMSLLTKTARRLASTEVIKKRTALEFSNEPETGCNIKATERWENVQHKFYEQVRVVAPALPLILTGDCWSGLEGLLRLDPTPYRSDINALFTVHFYEPRLVTAQGVSWRNNDYQYFDQIPFPFTIDDLPGMRARLRANIERAFGSNSEQSERTYERLDKWLVDFAKDHWDRNRIRARALTLSNWAKSHGISPSRIYIGEFGTFWSGGKGTGITRTARINWLSAVNSEFAALGMGRAIWADISVGSFGILKENDEPDNELTDALVEGDSPNCRANIH